ncbi:MAG: sulfite reductase subunit A, partial [Bacteroidota bacterium]
MDSPTLHIIDPTALESLFASLRQRGHTLVGPMVRDNAVVYDVIMSAGDLPVGWGDVQEPGKYRLQRRHDKAIFGYNLGPHSWKKFLFPPALRLFAASRNKEGVVFVDGGSNGSLTQQTSVGDDRPERYVFIGVRPCELSAMFVQDKVFMAGPYADPHYAALRDRAFIVAVNCSQSAETCFCTSMNTGPKAERGFDLSLTEVLNDSLHYFLVEVGSKKGAEVLEDVQHRDATDAQIEEANHIVHCTAQTMKRRLDTTDIKSLLQHNLEHPRWEVVASRCLACANCTMVCPTCFCTTVEDTTD